MRRLLAIAGVFALIFALTPPRVLADSVGGEDVMDAINNSELGDAKDAAKILGPLVLRMRSWAIVILMLGTVAAALATTFFGKHTLAVYIITATIVLSGGFWIFSIIRDPFRDGKTLKTTVTINAATVTNTTETYYSKPIKLVVNHGLALLGTAIIPFLISYGAWLAVAMSTKGEYATSIFNFIVGSSVCMAATAIAQLFVAGIGNTPP